MRPLAQLNRFYWRYKRLFAPGLICAVLSAGFSLAVPGVVRNAVDAIPVFVSTYGLFEGTPAAEAVFSDFARSLLALGGLVILLSLIAGVFSFSTRQTVVVASRHIEFDLRNELYEHLQRLSRDFYVDHPTGDLITRATSDIEQIRRYIGPALMYLTRALVIVVSAVTVMFIISPRLTLFALIPMPLLALSVFFVAHMVHSRSDALQSQYSRLTNRVQEALAGIRVVKAYTLEDAESHGFRTESDRYRDRMLDLAMVEAAWRPVFLLLVGLSIVVWVGGRLVMEGTITIGNIAEYIIYVALMTWPVASPPPALTMVQRASASVVRLYEILDEVPTVREHGGEVDAEIHGGIEFRGVSFRFSPEGPLVLDNVSFKVEPGRTLAVVGRTGSGKTTLVEMIPRLLEPVEGEVLLDDIDVTRLHLETVRSAIGYVPQDVFLFSDTVANNIAFGKIEATEDEIAEAAREAELLENVQSFPAGFETFVGERGITLSGGQKQRTSIGRALIRRPRILILDDALSAVDTGTERSILGHLKQHYGERTIVIVSHRISAVQDADLILVLDSGRVVERGSHESLLPADGLYASLHRKQLLEEELEAIG
jgi:ATP-binding cassette subfamily B protein